MSNGRGRSSSRLAYIDGLRGIAALVVAVGHIAGMVPPDHPVTDIFHAQGRELAIWPFLFGEPMVWLFIMLSAFALYFSEHSRRERGRRPTTAGQFVQRRAWRILPTYYVSLALGAVVLLALPSSAARPAPSLDTAQPVTTAGVVTHLLLIHNLRGAWKFQINSPLWSIALEAQLYVAFPLLFWGLRRWRPVVVPLVLIAAVKGIDTVTGLQIMGLMPWFAVGALAGHIATHVERLPRRTLIGVGLVAVLGDLTRVPDVHSGAAAKAIWMIGFAALLIGLSRQQPGGWNAPTWRPVTWLGQRSYSLYVVHFPLGLAIWAGVATLGLSTGAATAVMVACGVPAAILAAHVCYLLVERPSKRRSDAVGSAGGAPVEMSGAQAKSR